MVGAKIDGLDVCKTLRKKGFSNIYLYTLSEVTAEEFVFSEALGVVDKSNIQERDKFLNRIITQNFC